MYNITVTLLKEVGVGKKKVVVLNRAVDYGWGESPNFWVEMCDKTIHYFVVWQMETVTIENVIKEITNDV